MDSQSRSRKRAKTAFVFCVVFNVKALLVYARIAASAAGEAASAWLKSAHLLYYQILPALAERLSARRGYFPLTGTGHLRDSRPRASPIRPCFRFSNVGYQTNRLPHLSFNPCRRILIIL